MRRWVAFLVCTCLLSISVFVPGASAQPSETIETLATRLPYTLAGGAAVWTGSSVYLIGGIRNGANSDAITRFDPAAGTFVDETPRLPGARYSSGAVWTGTEILIFGGATGSGNWNDTLRFNPATHQLRVGANLTRPGSDIPAIWTGQYAYLFGGAWGFTGVVYEVSKYDPQADAMTVVTTARMPTYSRQVTATWDGTRATLFGGDAAEFRVMTFDPASGTFTYVNGTEFRGVITASSALIGAYAYVFGGWDPQGYTSRISRFRTGTTEAGVASVNLTRPHGLAAAVAAGDRVYLFGGWNGVSFSDAIQVFRSGEGASVFLWIGIAAIIAVAVGVAIAIVVRRRRKREVPPKQETPQEPG